MSEEKLLPCPKCHGNAMIWEGKALAGNKLYRVECKTRDCIRTKNGYQSKEKAIETWNTQT